jgi:hypothetical protein
MVGEGLSMGGSTRSPSRPQDSSTSDLTTVEGHRFVRLEELHCCLCGHESPTNDFLKVPGCGLVYCNKFHACDIRRGVFLSMRVLG